MYGCPSIGARFEVRHAIFDGWCAGVHTQGFAMELPCSQVVRAVDRHTTSLLLLFGLVLAKPKELSRNMVPGYTASVGVDEITVSIVPSTSGDDPFGRSQKGEQSANNEGSDGHHGRECKSCFSRSHIDRLQHLPDIFEPSRQPQAIDPRGRLYQDSICGSTWRRRRNCDFSVAIPLGFAGFHAG